MMNNQKTESMPIHRIEMRPFTEEEMKRLRAMDRKLEQREMRVNSLLHCLRRIFFTPLAIAFRMVAFAARGAGYISSFGLIAGAYYLYQSLAAFQNHVPLAEINTLPKALILTALPFGIYTIAELCGGIYNWLDENAF